MTEPNGSDSPDSPSPPIKPMKQEAQQCEYIEYSGYKVFQAILQDNPIYRETTYLQLEQREKDYKQRYLCCWRAPKIKELEKSDKGKNSQERNTTVTPRPAAQKKERSALANFTLGDFIWIFLKGFFVMYLLFALICKLLLIPIATFRYPDYFLTDIKHTGRLGLALSIMCLIVLFILFFINVLNGRTDFETRLVFNTFFVGIVSVTEVVYAISMLAHYVSFKDFTKGNGLFNMYMIYCSFVALISGLGPVILLVSSCFISIKHQDRL